MTQDVLTILGYLAVIVLILIFGSRGFYRFYTDLGLYHKTIADHDPCIELRNADGVANPESYANVTHVQGTPPEDLDLYYTSEEVKKQGLDPEVVVDFEAKERRLLGEQTSLKYARVWLYTAATTLLMTQLTISYLLLLVDFFSFEEAPSELVALSILVLVAFTHLAFRLSSFFHIGSTNWDDYGEFKDSLYNFLFSFNMSILTLWLISLFAFMVIEDATPTLFEQPFPELVIGGSVIVAAIVSIPGELLIRRGHVPEAVQLTNVRDSQGISPDE